MIFRLLLFLIMMKRQRVDDSPKMAEIHSGLVASSDGAKRVVALSLVPGDHETFFFARGLIPPHRVLAARDTAIAALKASGDWIEDESGGQRVKQGLLDRQDVAASVSDVLEAPELVELVKEWTNSHHATPFHYKWLRAVNVGKCTGWHVDRTYLEQVFSKERTKFVVSAWIPLGRIDSDLGGLLICNNDKLGLLEQCLKRRLGQDGTESGWIDVAEDLLNDPSNFVTTIFEPGDVVIFKSDLVHCTMINNTNPSRVRLSCDVRFETD